MYRYTAPNDAYIICSYGMNCLGHSSSYGGPPTPFPTSRFIAFPESNYIRANISPLPPGWVSNATWQSFPCLIGIQTADNSSCWELPNVPPRQSDIADISGTIVYFDACVKQPGENGYTGINWTYRQTYAGTVSPNSGMYCSTDYYDYCYGLSDGARGLCMIPHDRHLGGFNVAYADGHVKWARFGSTRDGDYTTNLGD
jgi:prepilin-type processing-associated H-X9-DG protein